MTERQFSASRKGHLLASILQRPEVIAAMVVAARNDRPAVEAIDGEVAALIGPMADEEKKAAGRMVKRVLAPHGLRPFKKGQRVLGGQVFTRGTVYRQVLPAQQMVAAKGAIQRNPGEDAIDAARRLLAASRRNPDQPVGGVDDFLAERRAMWGEA